MAFNSQGRGAPRLTLGGVSDHRGVWISINGFCVQSAVFVDAKPEVWILDGLRSGPWVSGSVLEVYFYS